MENKIIGFFLATQFPSVTSTEQDIQYMRKQGNEFGTYIWNEENSLDQKLKSIQKKNYGFDIELILFEFYLNPIPEQKMRYKKELGNYRKNERSISCPIFVTNDNFFNKSETERRQFLREQILYKIDLVTEVVKSKKLDTDMSLLKSDLADVLDEFQYIH